MEAFEKKYLFNEEMEKVGVLLDLPTFEKMEQLLEDYALAHYMQEEGDGETLGLEAAHTRYQGLEKAD